MRNDLIPRAWHTVGASFVVWTKAAEKYAYVGASGIPLLPHIVLERVSNTSSCMLPTTSY
eukprot:4719620-Pleurochrysis_carterae.AAC.1